MWRVFFDGEIPRRKRLFSCVIISELSPLIFGKKIAFFADIFAPETKERRKNLPESLKYASDEISVIFVGVQRYAGGNFANYFGDMQIFSTFCKEILGTT